MLACRQKSLLASDCIYTSQYCEENAFHLVQTLTRRTSVKVLVLFISNPAKRVSDSSKL